jgi:hypothetical protein
MTLGVLLEQGLLSSACLDRDVCSGSDHIVSVAAATLLLALALVISMGWRGRGARRAQGERNEH